MAELARGTVFDRPWGRTLATLGLRGVTGQLTLFADGKNYDIAFSNGAVVGAWSPVASDAAVRVALTGGLVSTTQVAELARKQAANPNRDEVDLIAEHLRIGYDQAIRLRRRTIAQRAARSFSVDKGEFVLDDTITLHAVAGSELDIRAIIYLGARQNLSEVRLASELGLFGTWFRLKPEAFEDLPQFGFADAERPIIDALLAGASLGELEGIVGMDARTVRATLYALCAANACNVEQTRGQGTTKPPPGMRGSNPGVARAGASQPPSNQPTVPAAAVGRANRPTQQPLVAYRPGMGRTKAPSSQIPNTTQTPRTSSPIPDTTQPPRTSAPNTTQTPRMDRATAPPMQNVTPRATIVPATTPARPAGATAAPTARPAATTTSPTSSRPGFRKPTSVPPTNQKLVAQVGEVQQLIAARAALLDRGADHYQLLGIAAKASADDVRKAYFGCARQLHPDRLAALGIDDSGHVAHKVFAQLNTAFSVLSDAKRRAEYDTLLGRGGEAGLRAEQAKAEEMTLRIMEAEEAFKRGEMALKRDDLGTAIAELAHAVELNPDEPDFYATHAWAMFCAASDKTTAYRHTRATLEKAMQRSPRAINPRFYLGRVERILGHDKEALQLFRDVLVDKPHHFEAQSEVRAIEARLQAAASKGKKR